MIGGKLVENGSIVKYSEADADIDIVLTAIKESENQNVVLIGEETDLPILLLYHAPSSNPYKLMFRSDKRDALYSSKIFDIYVLKSLLSDETCSSLVFTHAFTGCDTTSAFYGIGKPTEFINQFEESKGISNIFIQSNTSKEDITNSGIAFLKILYYGKMMNLFKNYNTLIKKVSITSCFVKPYAHKGCSQVRLTAHIVHEWINVSEISRISIFQSWQL